MYNLSIVLKQILYVPRPFIKRPCTFTHLHFYKVPPKIQDLGGGGASWLWMYGSWIYNYPYNRCLTTSASSNPAHGEVYSLQHYVIKFVSQLRQVGGFLQVLQFPPPIKPTATI